MSPSGSFAKLSESFMISSSSARDHRIIGMGKNDGCFTGVRKMR
jgi:hypothetical protein